MNESGPFEHLPSPMSDEELIQELQRWGERQDSPSATNALAIQCQANRKSRNSIRLSLVACTLLAISILSTTWLTQLRHQDATPRETAMEGTSTAPDPQLLLKSIAQRTQEIGFQIEELNSRWDKQRQAASEVQELHSRLLNYRRIAIRNSIVLSPIP